MTDVEKKQLIKSYQDDYHSKTREYIKMIPCSKWDVMVELDYQVDLWKIIKVICDFTGWTWAKIYNNSKKQECCFKRGVIDFIAVHNCCSYNSCARLTDRDHVSVINSVSKFENRLETEEHTRRLFYEIINYLKENYYLYENQDITRESLRGVI